MKKMSKIAVLALAFVMLASLAACGGGKAATPAEVYTAQSAYIEAGYEGECVNDLVDTLVLNADGAYTWTHTMMVNHNEAGVIVYYMTTIYEGTYTVDSEADGVKTVTLSDATKAMVNLNGGASTSDSDSSLLEGGEGRTVTCDTSNCSVTFPG